MSHEKVCSWLALAPGGWPPDHYTLLGLERGEGDPARIEQHVHERLEQLRRHQLQDPEPVTEAMNLVARAYSCLTDPEAKRQYDAKLPGAAADAGAVRPPAANGVEVPSVTPGAADPLAWLFGPWNPQAPGAPEIMAPPRVLDDWAAAPPPTRQPTPDRPHEPLPEAPGTVTDRASDTAVNGTHHGERQELPARRVDPMVKVAHSPPARRGLATKRALYYRIARTRELLEAWHLTGKYLSHPDRPLVRSTEAAELTLLLKRVRRLLRHFPPLLGEAGQPGFYVITLAGQPKAMIVPTFRMLLPLQRETLARDWRDGLKLLAAHREFLRSELRTLRQTNWWGRLVRAADSLLTDHPGLFLLLTLLVAVAAATLLSVLAR